MSRRPVTLAAAALIVAATAMFAAHAHAVGSWPGAVMAGVCALTGLLAAGLAAGWAPARELVTLVFTVLAVLLTPAAVASVVGAPTAPPVGLAVAGSLLDLTVVGLLCTARVTAELSGPPAPPQDPREADIAAFRAWLETVEPADFEASRQR